MWHVITTPSESGLPHPAIVAYCNVIVCTDGHFEGIVVLSKPGSICLDITTVILYNLQSETIAEITPNQPVSSQIGRCECYV